MIDQQNLNKIIVDGMKKVAGYEVVKSNLTSHIPPYPYISFTILNSDTKKGTYSDNDSKYIPIIQIWSITVQGDKDNEVLEISYSLKDWLEETGRHYLKENGIIVQNVGAITPRDTFLTVEYEYRKGFDVTFCLTNIIDKAKEEVETIESYEFNIEKEKKDGKK